MTSFSVSANFTRPSDTTAYADEDLVANSTTAGSVVPMYFGTPNNGEINRVRLEKSGATPTNANFTLYIFDDSPTVTNGDNGAFAPTESNLLGTVALDATTSKSTDDTSVTVGLTAPIETSGPVFGLLKAEAAYTPESAEVFTVVLFGKV
jgi:hypothetical protein